MSDAYATAALCDCLVFVVDADRQLRKPDPRVERLLLEYRKQIDQFRNDTSSSSNSDAADEESEEDGEKEDPNQQSNPSLVRFVTFFFQERARSRHKMAEKYEEKRRHQKASH